MAKKSTIVRMVGVGARLSSRVAPSLIHTVMAHSLGAAAATIAIARGLPVQRAVYFAPPSNPGDYLERAARSIGFSDAVARRSQARMEEHFSFRFEDASGTRHAERLGAPLLVIHDEGDRDVPHAEGAALAAVWPGARLLTTVGLGHRRILRDPATVDAAVDFAMGGTDECTADLRHAVS
jgi:pimeloyl-ACP methyl ester carboxylesterase